MKTKSAIKPRNSKIYLYLLPGLAIYAFVVLVPLVMALRYSFFDWSGGPNMDFIGLDNFVALIQDDVFWQSFRNNLFIIIMSIIGQVGIAFLIAVLLTRSWVKWKQFHRTVIFIPNVLAAVIIGFLWSMIYNHDYGLLNYSLNAAGLESWISPWLDDPSIVMTSVTIPIVWQFVGFYLIIFMSAMQNIPDELYEAAKIDGATSWKQTWHITMPMLKSTFRVAIMLCIAGNMKVFDHIFVMTGGGPGSSSTVMAQYAYDVSFNRFELGYGSAVSIGMLALSLGLILISQIIGRGEKE
ncbi:putative ABC transporter permease protein YurN [Halolactibacillus miurensis]|uniref:ABC transporter permease protein YurN n=2 Tax=Halolactibacillus TaxID=306539 RepID=A0A1I6NYM9_9BACI|nr:sugar ABC transporter permease [Halolactibacillus miurensis]GEM04780.1 putative ABC transporter permease protein YurN [Halolactibacillus miurensis]SFS33009.1 raffinose/stachyose/melibiose transport system permease protein [Halolactibacillus miurensis]